MKNSNDKVVAIIATSRYRNDLSRSQRSILGSNSLIMKLRMRNFSPSPSPEARHNGRRDEENTNKEEEGRGRGGGGRRGEGGGKEGGRREGEGGRRRRGGEGGGREEGAGKREEGGKKEEGGGRDVGVRREEGGRRTDEGRREEEGRREKDVELLKEIGSIIKKIQLKEELEEDVKGLPAKKKRFAIREDYSTKESTKNTFESGKKVLIKTEVGKEKDIEINRSPEYFKTENLVKSQK